MVNLTGCYKKDYPEHVLRAFDSLVYTIVCIDPPGYGKSRPPDRFGFFFTREFILWSLSFLKIVKFRIFRKQEVNRCMKDAGFCIKLMEVTHFLHFL